MFRKLFKRKTEQTEEVKELLVLSDKYGMLGFLKYDDTHFVKKIKFVAYVDLETGMYLEQQGIVEWIFEKDNFEAMQYSIEPFTIYQVKCTVKKKGDANTYILKELVEEKRSHSELEYLQYQYQNPLVIKMEDKQFGTFTLDSDNSSFNAAFEWAGCACEVLLECDRPFGSQTAKGALKYFKLMQEEQDAWDKKFRNYGAEKLADGNTELFLKKLSPSQLYIGPDGMFTFFYNYGNPADGYSVSIDGYADKGIKDAKMVDFNKPLEF